MPRVPTAEQVAVMTPKRRSLVRYQLRCAGIALPDYLQPMSRAEINARIRAGASKHKSEESNPELELQLSSKHFLEERRQRNEALRRRGFPKHLPCLKCGKLRLATRPDDRFHRKCVVSIDPNVLPSFQVVA